MLIEKLIFVREFRRECEGHDGAASSDFKVPPINETCWWAGTVPIFRFQHFNIAFALFFLRYCGLSSAMSVDSPTNSMILKRLSLSIDNLMQHRFSRRVLLVGCLSQVGLGKFLFKERNESMEVDLKEFLENWFCHLCRSSWWFLLWNYYPWEIVIQAKLWNIFLEEKLIGYCTRQEKLLLSFKSCPTDGAVFSVFCALLFLFNFFPFDFMFMLDECLKWNCVITIIKLRNKRNLGNERNVHKIFLFFPPNSL